MERDERFQVVQTPGGMNPANKLVEKAETLDPYSTEINIYCPYCGTKLLSILEGWTERDVMYVFNCKHFVVRHFKAPIAWEDLSSFQSSLH